MNLHRVLYLPLWALFLLLAACSQDEWDMPEHGSSAGNEKSAPITIRLQTRASNPNWPSENLYDNVDAVRILVFGASGEYEENVTSFEYYDEYQNCITGADGKAVENNIFSVTKNDKGWWEAKARFTPQKGMIYRLYAIAYNKERFENVTLNLSDGKKLYTGTGGAAGDVGDISIAEKEKDKPVEQSSFASISINRESGAVDYSRLEFYVGPVGYSESLYKEGKVSGLYFTDDVVGVTGTETEFKDCPLEGKLHRATGRLSFHLTDIKDESFKKIRLVMEKYTNASLIGWGSFWSSWKDAKKRELDGKPNIGDDETHPEFRDTFGHYWNNQETTNVVVDEQEVTNKEVWLYADCIRTEKFRLYIQPVNAEGKAMGEYLIECKDKDFYPGYEGVVDQIVDNGLFTVIGNFWGQLNGPINNVGNLKIETDWEEDFNFEEELNPEN